MMIVADTSALLFLTGYCGISVKCSPSCFLRWDQGGSNSNQANQAQNQA